MNSSSDHFNGFSTRPSISNVHFARSMSGVPCASSTGHFFVRDWPGGMRLSLCVSGLMITSGSWISSGLRGSVVWYFGSLNRLSRKLIRRLSGSLSFSLSERDQFLRHPLADTLGDRFIDADVSIVPVVPTTFRPAGALVVFRLLQAEQNPRDHFVPVLKLNAAPDNRQACCPVFLRRTRILLGDRQIVERRKLRARKVFHQLFPNLFLRPVRMFLSQRLRTTKNVRDCRLLNHCTTF